MLQGHHNVSHASVGPREEGRDPKQQDENVLDPGGPADAVGPAVQQEQLGDDGQDEDKEAGTERANQRHHEVHSGHQGRKQNWQEEENRFGFIE